MIRVSVHVSGIADIAAAFKGVKEGVKNRVVKTAMRGLASRANKRAKAGVAKGPTGQLKRSIGIKYRSYRSKGIWVFLIGPRRGYRTIGKDGRPVNPIHYAHLVERGRAAIRPIKKTVLANRAAGVVFGRRVAPVAARPFMSPALQDMQLAAPGHLRSQIPRLLAAEVARYAKRGKSIYVG